MYQSFLQSLLWPGRIYPVNSLLHIKNESFLVAVLYVMSNDRHQSLQDKRCENPILDKNNRQINRRRHKK